ncbi:NAD(P)/FAD-dependent oxidoreductase [Kamptonema cortianum]|nr:NAD(P)/FAD-dependent oxidoreductase [Geitlerinema splendidum]MDK3158584.1 NAD(P)/FAD-dependent oxidoreductase [Kamptonema cortianum]
MNIAVIGAGISGLRTAQLLLASGHSVDVYEARSRVGGRLETVSIDRGGTFEAGGEWIDADHRRVINLMREYDLMPEIPGLWPGILLHQGEFSFEDNPWPNAATDIENVHERARAICRTMPDRPWESSDWMEYDRKTLAEWLDGNCVTPRGRWLAEATIRSDEGDDTDQISLLGWLIGYKAYVERKEGDMSAFRVPGGIGRLCQRIANELPWPVMTGFVLKKVAQTLDGAAVTFADGTSREYERVVLTLPPPCYAGIEMVAWEPSQKAAYQGMRMARAIKISMEFREPFWVGSDWPGRLLCDLPCQQVWVGGSDNTPVLSAYICGRAAEEMIRHPDPVGAVVRALAEVLPPAQSQFVRGSVHDWVTDEYCQGAFTMLAPGTSGMAQVLSQSWGKVHFAGEHTAGWLGFIEGALESAERVVQEINHDGS